MNRMKEIENLLKECKNLDEFYDVKNKILEKEIGKDIYKILDKYEKELYKKKLLEKEYERRCEYEKELIKSYKFIAGVDEVGRGPLAGPVYAAAVILDIEKPILGIKDSKKLTEKQRLELYDKIKAEAIDYSLGYATVEEIDELNILEATKLAMLRALEGLKIKPDIILIDALKLDVDIPQISIIKGDDLSVSIGAASIIAKVERDLYMQKASIQYPFYNFTKNKGYGTREHIEAIKKYGPCEIHRRTFIRNIIG
ncbi:MAG: ribonuclease HII [Caloramator sp.]|nr:ribonuclease HII [Caloramator sp.]